MIDDRWWMADGGWPMAVKAGITLVLCGILFSFNGHRPYTIFFAANCQLSTVNFQGCLNQDLQDFEICRIFIAGWQWPVICELLFANCQLSSVNSYGHRPSAIGHRLSPHFLQQHCRISHQAFASSCKTHLLRGGCFYRYIVN
jgi:hypothetical protein